MALCPQHFVLACSALCAVVGTAARVPAAGLADAQGLAQVIAHPRLAERRLAKHAQVANSSRGPPSLYIPKRQGKVKHDSWDQGRHAAGVCDTLVEAIGVYMNGETIFRGMLKGVCSRNSPAAQRLTLRGCLYVPVDTAMDYIFQKVDKLTPEVFDNWTMDAFFEVGAGAGKCPSELQNTNSVSIGGTDYLSCSSAEGFLNEAGTCVTTSCSSISQFPDLYICEASGLMGIPPSLQDRLEIPIPPINARFVIPNGGSTRVPDWGAILTIPLEFTVCDEPANTVVATDEQIDKQIEMLNKGFAGTDTCERYLYSTQQVDTQIRFVKQGVTQRVVDSRCGADCFTHFFTAMQPAPRSLMDEFVPYETDKTKIFICGESVVLGVATLAQGGGCLLNFRSLPEGGIPGFDMGKTLTHELGHYYGLYNTFGTQGSCEPAESDDVDDTNLEETPHYDMITSSSTLRATCGSSDPVHNFMDYSFDKDMCTFTAGQKSRMWAALHTLQPDLLVGNLQTPPPTPAPHYATAPPTPAPPTAPPTPVPTWAPIPTPAPVPTPAPPRFRLPIPLIADPSWDPQIPNWELPFFGLGSLILLIIGISTGACPLPLA